MMETVLASLDLCRSILNFAGPTAELPFCLVSRHKVRSWLSPSASTNHMWIPLQPGMKRKTEKRSPLPKGEKVSILSCLNGKEAISRDFLWQLEPHLKLARWYWTLHRKVTGQSKDSWVVDYDIRHDTEKDDIIWRARELGGPWKLGLAAVLEGKGEVRQIKEHGWLAYHLGVIPLGNVPRGMDNASGCLRIGAYRAAADFIHREGMGDTDIHKMGRDGWTLDQIKYLVAEGLLDLKKIVPHPLSDPLWMTQYFAREGVSFASFITQRARVHVYSLFSSLASHLNLLSDEDVTLLFVEVIFRSKNFVLPCEDEKAIEESAEEVANTFMPLLLTRSLTQKIRERVKNVKMNSRGKVEEPEMLSPFLESVESKDEEKAKRCLVSLFL